jgi:hypothetical protein
MKRVNTEDMILLLAATSPLMRGDPVVGRLEVVNLTSTSKPAHVIMGRSS